MGDFLKVFIVLGFALGLESPAHAKRSAPPIISPVVVGDIRYEVNFVRSACGGTKAAGFKGSVLARKIANMSVLWERLSYQGAYNCKLETDTQEVFPASLSKMGPFLQMTDERGAHYVVDAKSGDFVPPSKVIHYP